MTEVETRQDRGREPSGEGERKRERESERASTERGKKEREKEEKKDLSCLLACWAANSSQHFTF